ncbi:hypothetical protein [Mycobacterium deserti]|uniref:Secreted protein n=1 Tax=Mycobacterium deserti TaxID=2978347 RepID=A0ABT2M947_9MYCO|nr:hypothetical protein [Mycobacterium deserti]MCT7658788.1 hypothetical protein [Mycobacterium deserti]
MSISRVTRFLGAAVAAAGFLMGPAVLFGGATTAQSEARPCYNGIIPGNPWVQSCSLPDRGHKIRGSAPDANAIIACRDIPGCLSAYVNGPW